MAPKSNFLDKVLGRIGRLDAQGLQSMIERLARERNFLETLFNTIEDGVLVLDENGRILYYNQAVSQLLGLQGSMAEGQPLNRYMPELDWRRLADFDHGGGHRVVRHEFEITFPRYRFLRLYAAPLDGESRGSSGMALILHDATEARQKTFETIESERIHALTLLAGSVAHEIGNPLNALHIHLQLLERQTRKLRELSGLAKAPRRLGRSVDPRTELAADVAEIAGKMETYLNVAKGEITRLDYIITQFLHALRPSQPNFQVARLNDVVRETLDLLRPELENRGQRIEERLAASLPETKFDPVQMKQVLVNLIKNAMQAMTKGGILSIQTGSDSDQVWVSVSDTGRGVPEELLNRIFEPFFTTKKKGSGLGLMIVQRIVRAHGGRIDLENRKGHGATFRISLPLHDRRTRLLEAPLND